MKLLTLKWLTQLQVAVASKTITSRTCKLAWVMTALFLKRERNGQQHFRLTVSDGPKFSRHECMRARTIRAAYQATFQWTQSLPCFNRPNDGDAVASHQLMSCEDTILLSSSPARWSEFELLRGSVAVLPE